jgi:L-rhamnose isomerase
MNTDYSSAREHYAAWGVDTETALATHAQVPLSLHCWQGDDLGGFESGGASLGGGLAVTGSYPGKARSPEELRTDLDLAFALIPGPHRLNLHASYAELGGRKIDRDAYAIEHFQGWIDWCRSRKIALDFNPTFFSHPKAADGFTLSHADPAVRNFWIDHGIACRRIGAEMGRQLGSPCVTNVWIPDGWKDLPADRKAPRERLTESLDAIFAEPLDPRHILDAVESKLFGLGSESYVVGSHEFYLGYAITRRKLYCLDAGHFHPTEQLADKISSLLAFVPELLLHVSRGVRWDSDHVVLFDDPTRDLMAEVVRGGFLARTHIGLDFFDGSINRIAAWVIGARNTRKALLHALLEPLAKLRAAENDADFTARLAFFEEAKTLPFGAVWDESCRRQNVPVGAAWLDAVNDHQRVSLARRTR